MSNPTTRRTESNTTFLAKCSEPGIFEENRNTCRGFGLRESKDELRNIQRFVSQAIIALLSKYDIKQRDGKSYTSSCPKGFLQDSRGWLEQRGFRLIGWPEGLPTTAISSWRSPVLFGVAALFIKDTIQLEELSSEEKSKVKKAGKRVFRRKKSPQPQLSQSKTQTPGGYFGSIIGTETGNQASSSTTTTPKPVASRYIIASMSSPFASNNSSFASTATAVSPERNVGPLKISKRTKTISASSSAASTSDESSSEESSSVSSDSESSSGGDDSDDDDDDDDDESSSSIRKVTKKTEESPTKKTPSPSRSPAYSTAAHRSSSVPQSGLGTPVAKSRTKLSSFARINTPPQETLFDLPFGVDVTELTPTVVRAVLKSFESESTSSETSGGSEAEDEDNSEDDKSSDDDESDDDDDDDDDDDADNNDPEHESAMKRKVDEHLENSRGDKRGRIA